MSKTNKILAAFSIIFFNIFGLIAFVFLYFRSKRKKQYETVLVDKKHLTFGTRDFKSVTINYKRGLLL